MRNPNEFAVAAHWTEGFDESALQIWAENLRRELSAPSVTLGLVFMTPRFFSHAGQMLELLRVHAQIPLLVGCSSQGLIVGDQEVETNGGLVLGLYYLPGAELRAWHFTQEQVEANGAAYWHRKNGVKSDQNGWLVFCSPGQRRVSGAERVLCRSWGYGQWRIEEQVTGLPNGEVYEGGGSVSLAAALLARNFARVHSNRRGPYQSRVNLIQKIGNRRLTKSWSKPSPPGG
jgi:hypothetical protein